MPRGKRVAKKEKAKDDRPVPAVKSAKNEKDDEPPTRKKKQENGANAKTAAGKPPKPSSSNEAAITIDDEIAAIFPDVKSDDLFHDYENTPLTQEEVDEKCEELVSDINCAFGQLEELANHHVLPEWVGGSLEPLWQWLQQPH